jgi:hypothetical protein
MQAQAFSPGMVVALEHFSVFVTEFCKLMCCTKSRGSRACQRRSFPRAVPR